MLKIKTKTHPDMLILHFICGCIVDLFREVVAKIDILSLYLYSYQRQIHNFTKFV